MADKAAQSVRYYMPRRFIKKTIWCVSAFALLCGLLSLEGCKSLDRLKSTHPEKLGEAHVPAEKTAAAPGTARPRLLAGRNKNASKRERSRIKEERYA